MMTNIRLVPSALLALALVVAPGPVLADDDGQGDPATQELIQQGIALRRTGKDDAALSVFLDAERRAPSSVRVLLHVTAAAQATGKWLMAYNYLQKAALYRNEAYYQRYRSSIRSIEEAVGQHVGQFRALGSPAGAEVLVNGELVGTLPMNEAKVLETGTYVLEVKKAGYFPLQRPLTIAAGNALSQEAIDLKAAPLGTALGSDSQPASPEHPRLSTGAHARSALEAPWITWTLAAGSAAFLVTSGVAFAVREGKASHWNDDGRCLDRANPARTRDEVCGDVRQGAESAQRISVVSGVLGAGLGVAAIAHYFLSGGRMTNEREQAIETSSCGLGVGSVVCHGSF